MDIKGLMKNRSMKISIKDAVKRDARSKVRYSWWCNEKGNPNEDHRDAYSSNKRKRTVKPAGVKKEDINPFVQHHLKHSVQ